MTKVNKRCGGVSTIHGGEAENLNETYNIQHHRSYAPDSSFTKLIEWQVPESWLYPVTVAIHMTLRRLQVELRCLVSRHAHLHNNTDTL